MNRVFVLVLLVALAVPITPAHALLLPVTGTIRDFHAFNPLDFEDGITGVVTGIVQTTLGADGKPVYYVNSDVGPFIGGTHGVTAFNKWYNNTAGVNVSTPHTIVLDNSLTGDPNVYRFEDLDFFPIDGLLFGNEGNPHNYHFTYEIHSPFTYQGGETFTFIGDDDLWLFVNKKLVVDLGGVHPAATGGVSLDAVAASIGLTPGGTYSFDLFFAERHTVASSFRIDTSIQLQPISVPEPGVLPLLGAGLLALSSVRRRGRR